MRTNFKIIDHSPEYRDSVNKLPAEVRKELEQATRTLAIDPFSIARPLAGNMRFLHRVYLGSRGYRLICRIELNTKKVFLIYAGPRGYSYGLSPIK